MSTRDGRNNVSMQVHGTKQQPKYGDGPRSNDGHKAPTTRGKKSSFVDFEKTTIDAWDADDDDLSYVTTSKLVVRETSDQSATRRHQNAPQNIDNHGVSPRPALMKNSRVAVTKEQLNRSSSAPTTPSHLSGHRFTSGVGTRGNKRHNMATTQSNKERDSTKTDKFRALLGDGSSTPSLDELRKISWSGIPQAFRPTTWKLLSGYLPTSVDRRDGMLERKRTEYHNFVQQYYGTREDDTYADTYQQIHIDVPRMSPLIPLFQQQVVRDIFERILFIWAIRHPATGYVQGINDLVTPYFVVFLAEYIQSGSSVESYQVSKIPDAGIQKLEADCFWCFSKLLDGIHDNYTFAQPGIQTRVTALKDLVRRIDGDLHTHLERHGIDYLQFSYRWMNNLLMRELPLSCVVRLWDTYLAEPDGFAAFHLYVCAAFLTRFSAELREEMDFHGLMMLLQNLPTHQWSDDEVSLMLAEAYRLKFTFADAPNHFKDGGGGGAKNTAKSITVIK